MTSLVLLMLVMLRYFALDTRLSFKLKKYKILGTKENESEWSQDGTTETERAKGGDSQEGEETSYLWVVDERCCRHIPSAGYRHWYLWVCICHCSYASNMLIISMFRMNFSDLPDPGFWPVFWSAVAVSFVLLLVLFTTYCCCFSSHQIIKKWPTPGMLGLSKSQPETTTDLGLGGHSDLLLKTPGTPGRL